MCVNRKGDVMTIGKMIVYSLSTNVSITLEELEEKAEEYNIPFWILPTNEHVEIKRLRTMLQKAFFYCNGINIRENGGVVFIPKNSIPTWNDIRDLIKSVYGFKELVEISYEDTQNNKGIIQKKFKDELDIFLNKEVPNFKDERGNFRLPRVRIDLMNCTKSRIEYMRSKTAIYSGIVGGFDYYIHKINFLYDGIQEAIEMREEEIEEEKLYGY